MAARSLILDPGMSRMQRNGAATRWASLESAHVSEVLVYSATFRHVPAHCKKEVVVLTSVVGYLSCIT